MLIRLVSTSFTKSELSDRELNLNPWDSHDNKAIYLGAGGLRGNSFLDFQCKMKQDLSFVASLGIRGELCR